MVSHKEGTVYYLEVIVSLTASANYQICFVLQYTINIKFAQKSVHSTRQLLGLVMT